jgi:hypothetical protein
MRGRPALFCVTLTALAAFATLDAFAEPSTDKISLGKSLMGPEWTKDKLEGQVILYEFWGKN